MSQQCTCNTLRTKNNTCYRCKTQWTSELSFSERVSSCADEEHRMSIAICGRGPPLCKQCEDDGYFVQPSLGWGQPPTIEKKDE